MSERRSLSKPDKQKLLRAAQAARKNAYCPHSGFAVGAAVLSGSGKIYRGVNVENASFGATVCAERAAILSAISDGETNFKALAVSAGEEPPVPCGQCLQVIAEFASPSFPILLTSADMKQTRCLKLRDLLPEAFIFTK